MPGAGASQNAPPSNADIARVAVAALIDPDKHDGRTYRPTGPRLLSIDEMAQILGRVLGRKVRHVDIPMWLFFKAARMDGIGPFLMDALRYYVEEQRRGTFAIGAPTDHVLEVTGREPEDFETMQATRRASESRRDVRQWDPRSREFLTLRSGPASRRPGFEREQGFPKPARPRLAIDDGRWRIEHGLETSRRLDLEAAR